MWVIVALVSVVVVLAVHWTAVRPAIRRQRLAHIEPELGRMQAAQPSLGRTPAQQAIGRVLDELSAAERAASVAAEHARALPVPVPELPAPGEGQKEVLSRLAQVLDDRRVAVGVAAGEQVVANLLDVLRPDAAGELVAAGSAFLHSGVILQGMKVAHDASGYALDLLNDAETFEKASGAVHGVMEAADHVGNAVDLGAAGGFHFPVVTLLVSTVREGALLLDDKTSVERALAHIAVDTGATAVGGFGGMKAGLAVGAFFGPVGAAIGAAVGGIAGAAGGRYVAKEVRFAPLRQAVSEFEVAHQRMNADLTTSAHEAARRVHDQGAAARAEYLASIGDAPSPMALVTSSPRLHQLAGDLKAAMIWQVDDAQRVVGDAASIAVASVPRASWYHVALGLDVAEEARTRVEWLRRQMDTELRASSQRLQSLSPHLSPLTLLYELASVPVPTGGQVERVMEQAAQEARQVLEQCLEQRRAWSARVARSYQRAVRSVSGTLEVEAERHRDTFEQWRQVVEERRAEVDRHRAALGLT